MSLSDAPSDRIGGFRILRRIGSGSRADVLLAAGEVSGRTVALKVFHDEVDAHDTADELQALALAQGVEHVQPLLDIVSDRDGRPVLVLERLGPSLGRVLVARGPLTAGELVTALAPIAAAVAELHRLGVLHGDLRLESVLFRQDGAPVLTGFGAAAVLPVAPSPARLAIEPLARADRLGLVSLARAAAAEGSVDALLEEIASGAADDESFPEALVDRLFGLESARPVRLEPAPVRLPLPGRLPQIAGAEESDTVDPLPSWLPLTGAPEVVTRALQSALGALRHARDRLTSRVEGAGEAPAGPESTVTSRGAPRPVVVGGVLAAALTVGALLLMPGEDRAEAGGAAPPTPPVPSASASIPPPSTAEPAHPDQAAVEGDDPVAALGPLLAAREECLRSLSVLCLDAVHQQGSAAMAADGAAIRALERGEAEPWLPSAEGASLVERLGSGAIVELPGPGTEPASVLMIRTEAGWRIRALPG